jgi:enoyl-CoA hydratase/carnithine racemase
MADAQRYESGLVVEARGHVRVLTLDRPERRNALSSALQGDLVEQLLRCGEDGEVRAVVLAANGPAFCAGFDLDEIREQDRRGERFRPPMDRPTRALFEVVTEVPVPVLAAIAGAAVAGGFELALACDLRVVAPGVRMGLPEAKIGMGANFGSVVLPKRIPMGIALELLYTGEYVTRRRAAHCARAGRRDRRQRPAVGAPDEGDRGQGAGAAAVAGAAARRRPEPVPLRGPQGGHRRPAGEACPPVERALTPSPASPEAPCWCSCRTPPRWGGPDRRGRAGGRLSGGLASAPVPVGRRGEWDG